MEAHATFTSESDEYAVRPLTSAEHSEQLAHLFAACADFSLLVSGETDPAAEAASTFEDAPPGHLLDNKFVYGVFGRSDQLVGVLEGMRHYPEPGIWWIGLLLFSPAVRGHGLGSRLVRSFAAYAYTQRATALMLGVVAANTAGLRFWQGLGFATVRKTEPRAFGQKQHVVHVLRLPLDSVTQHRHWQAGLDPQQFLDEVFGPREAPAP